MGVTNDTHKRSPLREVSFLAPPQKAPTTPLGVKVAETPVQKARDAQPRGSRVPFDTEVLDTIGPDLLPRTYTPPPCTPRESDRPMMTEDGIPVVLVTSTRQETSHGQVTPPVPSASQGLSVDTPRTLASSLPEWVGSSPPITLSPGSVLEIRP